MTSDEASGPSKEVKEELAEGFSPKEVVDSTTQEA